MNLILRRLPLRLFALTLLAFAFATPSHSTIQYQISLAHPEQHIFRIKMTIPDVKDSVTVQMPTWNALYEIRDFASHVREVKASNESGPLPIEKLDKQTWRVTGSGKIAISYDTFWDEPGPFSSQLNSEHAFINPAMILMYAPSRRSEELELAFNDIPAGWKGSAPWFVDSMTYDSLADAPFEIGIFDRFALPGVQNISMRSRQSLRRSVVMKLR